MYQLSIKLQSYLVQDSACYWGYVTPHVHHQTMSDKIPIFYRNSIITRITLIKSRVILKYNFSTKEHSNVAKKFHKNYIPNHNYYKCGYFWNPQSGYFRGHWSPHLMIYRQLHKITNLKFFGQSLCFGFLHSNMF